MSLFSRRYHPNIHKYNYNKQSENYNYNAQLIYGPTVSTNTSKIGPLRLHAASSVRIPTSTHSFRTLLLTVRIRPLNLFQRPLSIYMVHLILMFFAII